MGRARSNVEHARGGTPQGQVSRAPAALAIVPESLRACARETRPYKELAMSGSFEKREKSFETKWAHDEELRFKTYARRNKLLGLWAAGEMGIAGAAAEAYAKEVIAADFEKPGEEDVFEKVRRDFDARGVAVSDHVLRRKMEELLATAKTQLAQEMG
jgi:hypothetical protein